MRRFRVCVLCGALVLPISGRAVDADVSGRWSLNIVDKDATHRHETCVFVQSGTRLTGACGPENTEGVPLIGEINGNELRWQVERGPSYKAVLDRTLRFMKGTFQGTVEGLFTAMKTK
jgi:hypothetical protein